MGQENEVLGAIFSCIGKLLGAVTVCQVLGQGIPKLRIGASWHHGSRSGGVGFGKTATCLIAVLARCIGTSGHHR